MVKVQVMVSYMKLKEGDHNQLYMTHTQLLSAG